MTQSQIPAIILFVMLVIVLSIVSCKKQCNHKYLGAYYLSEEQLSWVTRTDTTVTFKNASGETLNLQYSPLYTFVDNAEYFCNTDHTGCYDTYDHEKGAVYLSNFSSYNFQILLEAAAAECDLEFRLMSVGTVYGSYFSFGFEDSIYPYGTIPYSFSDSVNLDGFVYKDVYYNGQIPDDHFNNDSIAIIYFTKQLGIVGFTTDGGITWVLQ